MWYSRLLNLALKRVEEEDGPGKKCVFFFNSFKNNILFLLEFVLDPEQVRVRRGCTNSADDGVLILIHSLFDFFLYSRETALELLSVLTGLIATFAFITSVIPRATRKVEVT